MPEKRMHESSNRCLSLKRAKLSVSLHFHSSCLLEACSQ